MLPPFLKDETRRRKTNVRGKVLICACKKEYPFTTVMQISEQYQYERLNDKLGWQQFNLLPLGKAIAIGELVNCYPMKLEHANDCFVAYREGLWLLINKNVDAFLRHV